MNKITNHNCDGMCCEINCNNTPTYFTKIEMNGLKFVVGLCDKHAEEYYENEVTENGKY